MKFVWVAAFAGALAGAPALAEEFGVPVDVPSGSVIEVTIEKTGEQTVNGATTPVGDFLFRYRQEITATDGGYTVTQTALDMQGPPEAKASLDAAMATTQRITFDTDDTLTPVRVRDVDALLAAITKTDGATPEQVEAQEQAVAMFKRLSPEQLAATLLREQALAAAYQGLALPVGETVEVAGETPNPFGAGPGIRQVMTATLTSVDEDRGVAVIEMNEAVDPTSVKAALPQTFRTLFPDEPPPTPEDLAQISFEKSDACRYEIDLQSGLATTTECNQTRGGSDKEGSRRTVTRTRITQKLIRPEG